MTEKIRVLHVLRPASGGMREHVMTLMKKTDKRLFDLMLACPWNSIVDRELFSLAKGIFHVEICPQANPVMDFKCISRLADIIKENDIQVVHTHGARAGFLGRAAAVWARAPVTIATVHNFVYQSHVPAWQKLICCILEKGLSRSTSGYITVSRALAEEISRVDGIPHDKIHVVYNGINLENFNVMLDCKEKTGQLGLRPNATIIGTAGRLIATKGVSYFIEAAEIIKERYPATQFLVVGEGPERRALEKLAQRKGLGTEVLFTGYRRDFLGILPLMSIFVVPSLSEGQSIVTLEAMAARRPIVAFKTGGIPEMITHNRSGILVPEIDSRALAKGIIHLLENPRFAEKLGNTARTVVERKFQQDQMVEKIQQIYRQCLIEKGIVLKPAFST